MIRIDQPNWQEPIQPHVPSYNNVHIWYGNCSTLSLDYSYLFRILSLDEKNKADRYKFDLDRNRFIARRAILRLILSQYIDQPPGHLEISSSSSGKLGIFQKPGKEAVFFSLSHSQDVFIYAIGRNPKIGIDVEYMHKIDFDAILETLFSNHVKHFQSTGDNKLEFYEIWTALEAYLKATGEGFGNKLDNEFWIRFPLDINSWKEKDFEWTIVQVVPEKGVMATLMINIPYVISTFYDVAAKV